jgi:uncharacterized membrane protein (UPF0127 family)
MNRKIFFTIGIIMALLVVAAGVLLKKDSLFEGRSFRRVEIGSAILNVEVADTPEARQQGLSDHKPLTDKEGMLFIFPAPARQTFWMIDMNFPLDMIWIGTDKKVVGITANVPLPLPDTLPQDLPLYQSPEEAQYVLEVNTGWAEGQGVKVGDKVEW